VPGKKEEDFRNCFLRSGSNHVYPPTHGLHFESQCGRC
jgi:hypothetical protein